MKLSKIIKDLDVKVYPAYADAEIETLTKDSRDKVKNGLFFCLRGTFDGHNYVKEAIKNGAVAIVTEKLMPRLDCVQVVTSDARLAYSYFSAAFYGNPQEKLKIIGIVGTNGKTSTANFIYKLLTAHGKRSAVVGTLGVEYGDTVLAETLTTPDPDYLFKLFASFVESKIEYAVMELSAHAIWLKKTAAINFECMIFTNCTHDHLDYFSDFYSYRKVKKSAFSKTSRFFVVNTDDPLGQEIYNENPKKTLTYGIYTPADVFAINIKESLNGLSFVLNMFDMVFKTETSLLGEFNVSNLLAAACACFLCGIKPEKIVKYIGDLTPVSGRMEPVAEYNGAKIFIDYAHTPDGLNKSLSFIAAQTYGETFLVFGAGGNRDKQKRPIMGKIAGDIADHVFITSDNPRDESPEDIIRDIEVGIKDLSTDYVKIPDRYSAISYAIERLSKGDSLLIAGKGAEEYQEVKGKKLQFSDKSAVLEIIVNLTGNPQKK